MKIDRVQSDKFKFGNIGISTAAYLEENVFLNKALVDASFDIPFICLANNKIERQERIRRVGVNYSLAFLSPFITIPITNRLAMKYIGKLTPKIFAKESNLIELSNKYLTDANVFKKGLEILSKEKKTDYSKIINTYNGDYNAVRKRLVNAKNAVLSFDLLFSSASISAMAFCNNALTKKKSNMDGYSAEFELADKELVEKRAAKYKKTEPLRKGIIASAIILLAMLTLGIKKGLNSPNIKGLSGFIKKNANMFDYTNGIFMKRLPFFLFMLLAYSGIALASRNKTELKNNLLSGSVATTVFFGGDIIINSILAKVSDKFLGTEILDKNAPKTFMNKIIPRTIPIKNLKGKSKSIAALNFFINLATLASVVGYGTPYLMNKIIRKDVEMDSKNYKQNNIYNSCNYGVFKDFELVKNNNKEFYPT